MVPLFSDQGRAQLKRIIRPGVLCAFDFDGTLCPFRGYENAILPDEVRQRLIRLQSLAPVAILTGRGMTDIRSRLAFRPDYLVATHGSEGIPGREKDSDRFRKTVDCWDEALKTALADTARYDRGISLDNKRYTLAVHYRKAADYDATEKRLLKLFEKIAPTARVLPGKYVYNLIPQGSPNKGDALLELMRIAGSRTAIFAGDDETDENVFRLDNPDILTVHVEKDDASQAKFYLETQEDIVALLDAIIETLMANPSPASVNADASLPKKEP